MQKNISQMTGQVLLHFGIAAATAAFMYMIQMEGVVVRVETLEMHANSPHPGKDYRELQDEKFREIKDDLRHHKH